MNSFITKTDGIDTLTYEDNSCDVECNVADFRDQIWWISIIKVVSKKSGSPITLTTSKQLELLQRIEFDLGSRHGIKEIYSSIFGVIIYDDVKDLTYDLTLL
ncbi:hypothetical protein JI666_13800 [Bacillus sp. NTK071]|uniref:hypothetical protein n=1 Tax=Bacillus sp. NTK071 TaxID=2802175 RepID=UPI001A8D2A0D|nr:hypothetical protein [Bacillus sp. NTK071]MBN8209826.1 hypothetical protein [Bacillus sp. NTK071]